MDCTDKCESLWTQVLLISCRAKLFLALALRVPANIVFLVLPFTHWQTRQIRSRNRASVVTNGADLEFIIVWCFLQSCYILFTATLSLEMVHLATFPTLLAKCGAFSLAVLSAGATIMCVRLAFYCSATCGDHFGDFFLIRFTSSHQLYLMLCLLSCLYQVNRFLEGQFVVSEKSFLHLVVSNSS